MRSETGKTQGLNEMGYLSNQRLRWEMLMRTVNWRGWTGGGMGACINPCTIGSRCRQINILTLHSQNKSIKGSGRADRI